MTTSFIDYLKCPISLDLMNEPVIVSCCNQTIDKLSLDEWLAVSNFCPCCRKDFTNQTAIVNSNLREIIEIVKKTDKQKIDEQINDANTNIQTNNNLVSENMIKKLTLKKKSLKRKLSDCNETLNELKIENKKLKKDKKDIEDAVEYVLQRESYYKDRCEKLTFQIELCKNNNKPNNNNNNNNTNTNITKLYEFKNSDIENSSNGSLSSYLYTTNYVYNPRYFL